MKKLTLGAIAGACAVAALVWSVPASASAVFEEHNHNYRFQVRAEDPPTSSVPEPGTMALLALGLGGLALRGRSRND